MHDLNWQFIVGSGTSCSDTSRLKVPGGWLIRERYFKEDAVSVSICFISEPGHVWGL